MLSDVRRKLEMAARVRDFHRAHPFMDPSHQALAVRIGELLTKAQDLAVQEQAGRMGSKAATRHRRALRQVLERAMIRYLSRVADLAAYEAPDLAGRFRLPGRRSANAAFIARAWDLVNLAREHQELLGRYGLGAGQLDEVVDALNRFEAATERANAGRRSHVGAHAQLNEVARQLMELLGPIDVLNRYRFAAHAEQLAAWRSARNVLGPFRSKQRAIGAAPPAGTEDRAA